ncbi:nodG [Symbiodinium microadriaticum]|nr:nodG [Symbiodinium microadriaticum]
MGKELNDAFAPAREVFQEVDDALGQSLSKLMWEGPEDDLTLTENAQPALMACSVAAMRVLQAEGGVDLGTHASFVAGHSLGEYSALAASGAFTLSDAAKLLKIRGQAMQAAVPVGEGAMAALLGLDLEDAQAVAADAAGDGEVCTAANDNAPGQVVVSGHKAAVEKAVELAKEKGAKRAVLLQVSAPFHCALMQPAADRMAEALADVTIAPPAVPLIANVTAAAVSDPETIRKQLVEQVTGMVRWRECVGTMAAEGVEELVEVGAGKILTGLVRRINRDLKGTAVGTPEGALVTGASGGIGGAVAKALHAAGATVALSGTRAEALEALAAELGDRAHVVPCNLSDAEAVAALPKQVEEAVGTLDILVNNAGLTKDNLFMRMKDDEFDQVIAVNLKAAFILSRGVLRGMMKRKAGRIISVTSVVGTMGNPGQGNYAASKAGLTGMTKSLAQEVGSRGITVNCVAPGFIATAMTDVLPDEQKEALLTRIPSGRLGSPEDVAASVLYLASDEAAYVTGQTLHVNGGMAMV